jgi:hypothetical protein
VFGNGIGLSSTLAAGTLVSDFQAAGLSLGLQVGALTTSTTINDALLYLGDQLPVFTLMGVAF